MNTWARLTSILNTAFFGLNVVVQVTRSRKGSTSGLQFETDPILQANTNLLVLIYCAVALCASNVGLFKLNIAKFAACLALPIYLFMIVSVGFVLFFYSGDELPGLVGGARIVFGVLGAIASLLLALCVKTIRTPNVPKPADEFE